MIQIDIDLAGLSPITADDVVVRTIADYAPAYAAIGVALHASRPLRVVVRHDACAAWLCRMQTRYGDHRVALREITTRAQLMAQWRLDRLPEWLTDEDIRLSKLLALAVQAEAGQVFEDVVLAHFFGVFLAQPRLPLSKLVDFLNRYEPQTWRQAHQQPLVARLKHERLDSWAATANTDGEALIVEAIRSDPGALRLLLSQFWLVRHYPKQLAERVLGPNYTALVTLPELDLGALDLVGLNLDAVSSQIEAYLRQVAQDRPVGEGLQILLGQVGGCLSIEFDAIERLVRRQDVHVDRSLLDRIRATFSPIRERVASRVQALDRLLRPPFPREPQQDWDVTRWLDWATRDYLPYRYWLEEAQQQDERMDAYASRYADWLYANFLQLSGSYPYMIYRAMLEATRYFSTHAVVLVVILDNFNYKFFGDLGRILEDLGYHGQSPLPCLSMLPSATEVSKHALVAGTPEPARSADYAATVESVWENQCPGKRVKYLPDVDALRNITRSEHELYVLNYLGIDDVLHSDSRRAGLPHAELVYQLLRSLCNAINDFALRLGIERELCIVTVSDHGSTRVPASIPNIIDPGFYTPRVTDKHHRYVAISDAELADLPQSVGFQCYVLERRRFGLPENYLAARGYYRFIRTEESYYVHGGLTPEETVLPFATFERRTVAIKPPQLQLLTVELRYAVRTRLEFELQNPNEYSLTDVELEVLSENVSAQRAVSVEIAGNDKAKLSIDGARIRQGPAPMTQLQVRLRYGYLGSAHEQTLSFPVTMKRMMTSSFDLTELG